MKDSLTLVPIEGSNTWLAIRIYVAFLLQTSIFGRYDSRYVNTEQPYPLWAHLG